MNILMLNYEFPPVGGGGATVSAQMAQELVCLGHTVDVITMHYGQLPREETVNGVRILRTWARRKKKDVCHTSEMATYLLGAYGPALKLTRQKKYDIIHAHFIIPTSPLAWQLRRRTGIPYIVTCHGSDVPGYNPDRFGLTHRLLMPVWKPLVKAANGLISPSGSLRDLIHTHCPSVPIELIPNGFDSLLFQSDRPRKPSILMCSRLLPRKGFQYVLEAVKDLKLDWTIHIVGEGPYLDTLKERALACRPEVIFHGWLDRNESALRNLYETSSIFVFPSESENFPTVLLEAMAAGMAILTSTAGGCPEVVGDAALLTEPKNPQAIREALLRLIKSNTLRQQLSLAGRRRLEQFSWANIARRHIQAYEQVIEKTKAK